VSVRFGLKKFHCRVNRAQSSKKYRNYTLQLISVYGGEKLV